MNTKHQTLMGIVMILVSTMTVSLAVAQEPPPPPPEGRGTGGQPPPSPEQRLQAQLQSFLNVGDVEWQVLQPKIDRIQTLIQQREHLIKPRPPRPIDPNHPTPQFEEGPRSLFTDLKSDPRKDAPNSTINGEWMRLNIRLNMLASNSATNPAELRNTLEQYHQVRQKSDEQLASAREELRQFVTINQEAILTVLGILD